MSPIVPAPQSKRGTRKDDLAETLKWQIEQALHLTVAREFRFHPTRRWCVDAVILSHMLAIEIEGGFFLPGGGRHTRGAGAREDCVKYSELCIAGFRLLRVLPEWVPSGHAFGLVERALKR